MQDALTTSPSAHKDRSGAIVAFGVLELLIALGCVAMICFTLIAVLIRPPATSAAMPPGYPPGYPPPAASLAIAALYYLGIAVVFGWLGVGSILARRWARTLSLALGWIWLVSGTIGGLFSLLLLPRIFAAMPKTGGPDMTGVAVGCAVAVIVPVLILLPIAFVLFYGGRNVRATFEARDPHPRWTDRCPFPVLVLALLAAFAVLPCALSALHPAFPFFGRLLTGAPGAAAMLLFALLQAALAWGLYKLRPAAWWGYLALWLVSVVSSVITFSRGLNWEELLRASGQPDNPMFRQVMIGMFQGPFFITVLVVLSLAFLGYLLWIKRYFRTS